MLVTLSDRSQLSAFLRQDPANSLYCLGDLDKPFFTHTHWLGWQTAAGIQAIVLLYTAFDIPVMIAMADTHRIPALQDLIQAALPGLPARLEMHLSPEIVPLIESAYCFESRGVYLRMLQTDRSPAFEVATSGVEPLLPSSADEAQAFYDIHYPGHAFDASLLPGGHFFCARQSGQLIATAGIHVFAPQQRVAAIGNVLTHPAWRGQGWAQRVTARLLLDLYPSTDIIGLNVSATNHSAIQAYTRLGFKPVAQMVEGVGVQRLSKQSQTDYIG